MIVQTLWKVSFQDEAGRDKWFYMPAADFDDAKREAIALVPRQGRITSLSWFGELRRPDTRQYQRIPKTQEVKCEA